MIVGRVAKLDHSPNEGNCVINTPQIIWRLMNMVGKLIFHGNTSHFAGL